MSAYTNSFQRVVARVRNAGNRFIEVIVVFFRELSMLALRRIPDSSKISLASTINATARLISSLLDLHMPLLRFFSLDGCIFPVVRRLKY